MKHPPLETPIRVMRIIARLNIGGPAIHVSLLTAGLNDGHFQSTLVAGVLSESEGDMGYISERAGISPILISSMQRELSPIADLKTVWALMSLMRKYRPHVVHTHTAKAGFVGRLAAFLTGVPIIVHTFHGHVFHGYFGRTKTMLFLTLERLAARASTIILTISEKLRTELAGYKIAPIDKIKVIPLGLDLTPLADLSNQRGKLREEFGLSSETKLVGIIGRLVPIKNHELFLSAAEQTRGFSPLPDRLMPDVRFLIVGDGERREQLEGRVDEMGLSDQVIFTGWRNDLPVILADLDLLVITSHNEGTPVSLIEAMAAGVPVISTEVGGVSDLLDGGQYGVLVEPDNAQQLAEAIQRVLAGDTLDIKAARQRALSHYSAERLVDDIGQLYLELLTEKGYQIRGISQDLQAVGSE